MRVTREAFQVNQTKETSVDEQNMHFCVQDNMHPEASECSIKTNKITSLLIKDGRMVFELHLYRFLSSIIGIY